jgi:hypothetical protein
LKVHRVRQTKRFTLLSGHMIAAYTGKNSATRLPGKTQVLSTSPTGPRNWGSFSCLGNRYLDSCFHLIQRNWISEERCGAHHFSMSLCHATRLSRIENDRYESRSAIGFYSTTNFVSIHIRHINVQQDNVRISSTDLSIASCPIAAEITSCAGRLFWKRPRILNT